jgi:Dolichyl-phosphate-mannose-protein mannosyltransferase
MSFNDSNKSSPKGSLILWSFAIGEVLLHLYTNAFAGYGYFRDELYYVACSKHLAAGYVDQPPFSIFVLAASLRLFGSSVFALRLVPALISGATVYLTGLIARKFGGGSFAIALACLSIAVAPEFLGTSTIFSMNSFDWFFWLVCVYIVVLLMEDDEARNGKLWIWLGIALGVGLMNKIDILWLGVGVDAGFLLTSQRKYFKTKWPYVAGAIALLLFTPYVFWNFTHNFATLEFIHRASSIKYSSQNPGTFISGAISAMNVGSMPVWLAGVYFFFFSKEGKKFRLLGVIFVVVFLILIVNWHSKPEYIAPAFPILFAGGGVMIEKIAARRRFAWTRLAVPAVVLLFGVISLPFALPILPVESFIGYSRMLGVKPSTNEAQHLSDLPQFYADMFGWENMASTVSKVYTSLSPDEQKRTVVFGQNYGEAGAIDFFSDKYPLPRVICGHNNYWFWGPGDTTFTTVIVIGGKREDHLQSCDSVQQVETIISPHAMPYETNLPVFICRHLKIPYSVLWRRVRFFI